MKIAQLSQEIGISRHTIRYYEKIGLLEKPKKDTSGHRNYGLKDIDIANWITCLKKSGMPLEKIKEYTHAYNQNNDIKVAELLEIHLQKLNSQQDDLIHYISVTEKKLIKLKSRLT